MPYVHIRITPEGATRERKAQIIKGVTDLLVDVLHKDPQATHVVIEEVPAENWGVAGRTVAARREAAQ